MPLPRAGVVLSSAGVPTPGTMGVMTLLFCDTEFLESGLDNPLVLISIALVTADGRELYCINADFDRATVTPWLAEHVIPYLDAPGAPTPLPRAQIAELVRAFVAEVCGDSRPNFAMWSGAYDWVLLNGLFGTMADRPARWPKYFTDLREWAQRLGNPTVPVQPEGLHSALFDARHDAFAHQWLTELEATRRGKRDNRLREQVVAAMLVAGRAVDLR